MPESEPRLLDLRLLPFAGICWAATLIGILGGSRAAWMLLTALSGTAVLLAAGCALRSPGRWTAGTLALLLFGSCCAAGVAWRVQAVERHPMTELARNETWVTLVVTPVDDPREIAGFGRHVLVNANVVRNFSIGGNRSLQFRLDVQNLLDSVLWANPDMNPTSTNFGKVTGATNSIMRFFTFVWKVNF